MSKTSSCFDLLKILYGRGKVVGTKELANILETNERNIPEYIHELRTIGYDIKTIQGRYGGYLLEKRSLLPSIKLTNTEINGLILGYNYITSNNDFFDKQSYQDAMNKIFMSTINKNVLDDTVLISKNLPYNIITDKLQKIYSNIKQSIENKNVINFQYKLDGEKVESIFFNPYKLFIYNNEWNVLGYVESKNIISYYNLNYIINYEQQNKHFNVIYSYNEHDYFDEFGLKNSDDWYYIELNIQKPLSNSIQHRIYGKNQTITTAKDHIILSCYMQNKINIIRFVLSFGQYCKVIKPSWLKESIIQNINNSKALYLN